MSKPTLFTPAHVELAKIICRKDVTDKDIAKGFGIGTGTLYKWKRLHPELNAVIKKRHSVEATAHVENAMYENAIGKQIIEQKAIKVKDAKGNETVQVVEITRQLAPNVIAGIFYLKNRDRAHWGEDSVSDRVIPAQLLTIVTKKGDINISPAVSKAKAAKVLKAVKASREVKADCKVESTSEHAREGE